MIPVVAVLLATPCVASAFGYFVVGPMVGRWLDRRSLLRAVRKAADAQQHGLPDFLDLPLGQPWPNHELGDTNV